MRYFVEIHQGEDGYHGSIHQGDPVAAHPLTDFLLQPGAIVTIRERSYTLADLVRALIHYQKDDLQIAYGERGQLEIGRYLYEQTFGKLPDRLRRDLESAGEVELRIVSEDEHIGRLPWVLLANNGVFRSTAGWSVALSQNLDCPGYELSPSPRMLVVAPQPAGLEKTQAEAHLEELQEQLSAHDRNFAEGRHLQIVYTWERFRELLPEFNPDIVYYYGHGSGDPHSSRLIFASGKKLDRLDKPIADVANCLRSMPEKPPLLIYLNCCQGDAGGFLGAGRQLGSFIPAVITNRTVAPIDAARQQALALWKALLIDGLPPHLAIARLRGQLTHLDFSHGDPRWMTPVLHCHYGDWKANPPRRISRLEHDPHWNLKIDRINQYSAVFKLTLQMLKERKPRSLAFVWYGEEGQGMEIFHQRLKVELREDLRDTDIVEKLPEWPADFHNIHRSFNDMFCEAFEVNSLEDIPARVRCSTGGVSGRHTLIYVRHQPVRSPKQVNPRILKQYLEWWDSEFLRILGGQVFALLGISFVVKDPPLFQDIMLEKEKFYDLDLNGTLFRLLDQMEELAKHDLLDFLRTHNIRLPVKRRDKVIEEILKQTRGHYDLTVEALKDFVDRAWDAAEESEPEKESAPEEYNY